MIVARAELRTQDLDESSRLELGQQFLNVGFNSVSELVCRRDLLYRLALREFVENVDDILRDGQEGILARQTNQNLFTIGLSDERLNKHSHDKGRLRLLWKEAGVREFLPAHPP